MAADQDGMRALDMAEDLSVNQRRQAKEALRLMPDLADVIQIDLSGVECAYFREWTDPEGEAEYLLFDQDGDLIISTNNRSMVFFFAVEHEIPLMTRH